MTPVSGRYPATLWGDQMSKRSWFRRHGRCHVATRALGDWSVLEFRGKFVAGEPEKRFRDEVDTVLQSGAQRVVVDLSDALLADDSVATAVREAYHKARTAGVEMCFVVQPGEAGGYYHLAGMALTIPTFSRLKGAIPI